MTLLCVHNYDMGNSEMRRFAAVLHSLVTSQSRTHAQAIEHDGGCQLQCSPRGDGECGQAQSRRNACERARAMREVAGVWGDTCVGRWLHLWRNWLSLGSDAPVSLGCGLSSGLCGGAARVDAGREVERPIACDNRVVPEACAPIGSQAGAEGCGGRRIHEGCTGEVAFVGPPARANGSRLCGRFGGGVDEHRREGERCRHADMHTHAYTSYTHAYTGAQTHNINAYMHTCAQTNMHACTHTDTHRNLHTYKYTCKYEYEHPTNQ